MLHVAMSTRELEMRENTSSAAAARIGAWRDGELEAEKWDAQVGRKYADTYIKCRHGTRQRGTEQT